MSTAALSSGQLRNLYTGESARIQKEFTSTGDGRAAVLQRAQLLDQIMVRLWEAFLARQTGGKLALAAVGGYGRSSLFPFSDVDLLLLHADREAETASKDAVRSFSQELWDLGIKLSPASRTLEECDRFDPNNVEFSISLLDCRFLAGDRELFTRLRDKVVLKLVMRDAQLLVQRLVELARARHAKYGSTVFHLEPNIKDAPGGLRDYNVSHWLALISSMEKLQSWPDERALLPASMRKQVDSALDFLTSVRCFLHIRHGRDDNSLTWSAQDEA
ncbi:MAG: DUF294 nucleotidyltransferase-like domain-containing protein, partial [Terriglobales bacterium]